MGRPKEFEEAEVLNKALEVFWERGYEATSIQDLVDRTGVQRASLYGTFGNKHDLYLATLDHYYKQEFQLDASEGLAGIRSLLRRIANEAANDCRGCYIVNAAVEKAECDPAVQERMGRAAQAMEASLYGALHTAQRAGKIRPGPLRPRARLLVTIILGLRVLAKTRAPRAVLDDVVASALDSLS